MSSLQVSCLVLGSFSSLHSILRHRCQSCKSSSFHGSKKCDKFEPDNLVNQIMVMSSRTGFENDKKILGRASTTLAAALLSHSAAFAPKSGQVQDGRRWQLLMAKLVHRLRQVAAMNGQFSRFVCFSSSPRLSLPFSTTGAVKPIRTGEEENPFIVDYLIKSCRLSQERALAASASLSSVKSPENPDSVRSFLRTCGLKDAQITRFISSHPRLLSYNVERFLAPKFKIFMDLGMSSPEVVELLQKTRLLSGIAESFLARRVEFLRSVVSNDKELIKVIKKSVRLLIASEDICKRMAANIFKFKELGASDEKVKAFIIRNPRLFQLKTDSIDRAILKVDHELGIPRSSGMYLYALTTLCTYGDYAIRSRFQIFKNFGWSMSEITTLFRRQPNCLGVSDERLRRGLEFLMKTAGLDSSYIATCPAMLMFSLEKRVSPRYDVFTRLKSKSLIKKNSSLYAALCLPEKTFLEKYVMRFNEEAPDVFEAYMNRMVMASKK